MTCRTHRNIAVLALILALAFVPEASKAQTHAHGSTWIHRNADHGTMLHAGGDSLCVLEFPDRCFGGMMTPDSVHCEFGIAPPESLPDWCPVAYDLEIHDPDGGSMMSGHMMRHGFFQRSLQLTIHYEQDAVAALGIDPADLVLVTSTNGYEILEEAVHDPEANVFRVSTSRPASWYGVADRMSLPVAVQQITWGTVKATYR